MLINDSILHLENFEKPIEKKSVLISSEDLFEKKAFGENYELSENTFEDHSNLMIDYDTLATENSFLKTSKN